MTLFAWSRARDEWADFENRVEATREQLGCSFRGAWFRGHEDEGWPLLPCAFRESVPFGLDDVLADFDGRPPARTELRQPRSLGLDNAVTATLGVIETDVAAQIRRLCSEIKQLLQQILPLQDRIAELTQSAQRTLRGAGERAEAKEVKRQRNELEHRRSDLSQSLAGKRAKVMTLRGLRYGEKDAYVLFRTRSAYALGSSSWETLAAMQHYGAPTRLLDWTDALAVAVYFATKAFRTSMVATSGSIANWLENHPAAFDLSDFAHMKRPTVWIMNPYRLARLAIGVNSVEDLSIRDDLDYFQCFHRHHVWPYCFPVPATLPWRTARMAAQRGYFTVHGNDVRGLDIQLRSRTLGFVSGSANAILGSVSLSPSAAIYAVRYVIQFVGLDSFALFRDEDNLGVTLKEFMRRL